MATEMIQREQENVIHQALRKYFGFHSFRGRQEEVIETVLAGKDCFCIMPTGGGKSLCYEIPALVKDGVVIVICPLIALMQNQVSYLKSKGISADFLSSAQTASRRNQILADMESGKPKLRLLYVTPETACTQHFLAKAEKLHSRGLINLLAVDEAHCISSWGHDFRPSYRKIHILRERFPSVPVLALTATAVKKVREDIARSLQLRTDRVLMNSFNRHNILYEVRYKDLIDPYKNLRDELRIKPKDCAIVYCHSRAICDELQDKLKKDGILCAVYHAGLTNKQRSETLQSWSTGKIPVIIATIAFGMGIDRGVVRLVCHFNLPKTLEGFYQESGRAGRDGQQARSILYYGLQDKRTMEFLIKREAADERKLGDAEARVKAALEVFQHVVEYCEAGSCRRKKLLCYFGETPHPDICNGTCDACKFPQKAASSMARLRSGAVDSGDMRLSGGYMRPLTEAIEPVFWDDPDGDKDAVEDISSSDGESERFGVAADIAARAALSAAGRCNSVEAKISLMEERETAFERQQQQQQAPGSRISALQKLMQSQGRRQQSKTQAVEVKDRAADGLRRSRDGSHALHSPSCSTGAMRHALPHGTKQASAQIALTSFVKASSLVADVKESSTNAKGKGGLKGSPGAKRIKYSF